MTESNNHTAPVAPGPGPAKRPLRKRWWFWPLVAVAVILLLPLLLAGAVLLALLTDAGTAWTIDQIPGLRTEADHGSLLGQWQADRLEWRGYGVQVRVQNPEVDWSPGCLFQKTICLDTLKASRVDVVVHPSESGDEPADATDIILPAIRLPVAVMVGDLSLGEFTYNGSPVWDRIELQTDASGASLTVNHALYQRGDILVTAQGRADMRRDWPVDLEVSVSLPPPAGEDWQIRASLGGSVRDLRVAGTSTGYLDARFNGEVQPLAARLPARLNLRSARFLAHDSLPPTLTLEDWDLVLNGSLANGFQARSRASLPATVGAITATLEGLVTTGGVRNLTLAMAGPAAEAQTDEPGGATGTLTVTGQVNWADALQAQGELDLDRFPWHGLVPGLDTPPVILDQLTARTDYRDGRYQAGLQASVRSPRGDAEVTAALDGDLDAVRITGLEMSTGAGLLTGEAELAFADQLAWQASLLLDRFNPGYWLPALEASLNGQIETQGRMIPDSLPVMTAGWDLAGRWQQQPATARGRLAGDGTGWNLDDLLVTVADNRIEGQGRYGEALAARLSVNLPQPDRLLPGLQGELTAEARLAGTPDDPTGAVTVRAAGLEWQDLLRIETFDLRAGLDSGGELDARLSAGELRVAGQELEIISAGLTGTREDHQLALAIEHPETTVELDLAGAFAGDWASWRGAFTRGEVVVPGQEQVWRLAGAASLEYTEAGEVLLGAHCWRWAESSVCGDDQQLLPDTRVAYQIRQFPLQALAPLFPETFRWDAALDADIELALTDKGPDGVIRLDVGSGLLEFLILDDWESLRHESLTLQARLKPEVAELALNFQGPELGRFDLDLSVDPNTESRPIDGTFSLQDLNLAFVSAFAGLEEVAGEVNGQGRLSGPLFRPEIQGELALTSGRVFDPGLPLPMEDIVLVLEFLGNRADISGRWQSNDRSQGQLAGFVDWQREPEVQLNISGERLPVTVDPYARLEVGPDLALSFRAGELTVSGRVNVPRGDIEIKGLPPSAVSVSEDEVIVGVEREEPTIRSMLMDITVVVGEDEVSFNAFDVTGNLEGTLRIGNDMDTRGTLQLVDGRYQAFGQDLDLRRARITFVGSLAEPYLDIEAVRTVDSVVAGIRLTGPVSSPATEVFSEPSMPQSDALSYIILGRAPQSQGDEGQMSRAAISLGLTQASKFTQGLGDELGIRNLTLEASGTGDESAVVASGYITDELSLRYGVGIFEPITTVALRYDLGRYFYLEAASGLAASLDIFYTRSF
ncbi:MAG TPA: translocation/assembly module TamB domain-containing protein [Marinobacter sp.]|nr:translocation/assembly module TamB domain-containing protein [Marinobacter sp.]